MSILFVVVIITCTIGACRDISWPFPLKGPVLMLMEKILACFQAFWNLTLFFSWCFDFPGNWRLRSINTLWHIKGAIGRWASHSLNPKLLPKVRCCVIILSAWILCTKQKLKSESGAQYVGKGEDDGNQGLWSQRKAQPFSTVEGLKNSFMRFLSIKTRTHTQNTSPGRSEILKSVPNNECVNLMKRQGHKGLHEDTGAPQGHRVSTRTQGLHKDIGSPQGHRDSTRTQGAPWGHRGLYKDTGAPQGHRGLHKDTGAPKWHRGLYKAQEAPLGTGALRGHGGL